MITPSEENQEEMRRKPPEPEEFEYEVVDPDRIPPVPDDDPLIDGKRQLQAIDEELAGANGPVARWGALIMLVAILLMLLLPRLGCTLKLHPLSSSMVSP